MADFRTHLSVAAAVSGVGATALMVAGVADPARVGIYFGLGTVGGLLPDIDSESSIPFRVAFTVLGLVAAFLVVFALAGGASLAELLLVWLACFAAIRLGAYHLFAHLTVHRGLVHSIPYGGVFGLVTVIAVARLGSGDPVHAWLCGAFVFLGFLVHLLLDEFYSVDLMGARIHRSFGSAFNLGNPRSDPLGTAALYLALLALLYLAPPAAPFAERLGDAGVYEQLGSRLWPTQGWFRGLLDTAG